MATPDRIAALRQALDERTPAEREHGARPPLPRAAVSTAVCAEALVELLELLSTSSVFGGRITVEPGPVERHTIDLMAGARTVFDDDDEVRNPWGRITELEVELERAVTERDRLAVELEEAEAAPPPAPARPQSEHLARTAEEALGRAERRNATLEAELRTANELLEVRGVRIDTAEGLLARLYHTSGKVPLPGTTDGSPGVHPAAHAFLSVRDEVDAYLAAHDVALPR